MSNKTRNKNINDKNLIWIDAPILNENYKSNAFEVGLKTWTMYNNGFNLTIKEITDMLKCERKWVERNVTDNVKHIFLNYEYRLFLNGLDKQYTLNEFNQGSILKDYYYFSRNDFVKWLTDNTIISRQTIQVDLSSFYGEIAALKANQVNLTKRTAAAIDVTNLESLPGEFITIKELKEDKSLELVYRKLYYHGALKYTICNSLVRYDSAFDCMKNSQSVKNFITIPYEFYLNYQ